MITERLKNDVIFVNVNGSLDYFDEQTYHHSVRRLERTKKIQDALHKKGLRCYRINPIDGDIPYVPYFPKDAGSPDVNLFNYNSYMLFDLLPLLNKWGVSFTHLVIFHHDGFPLNVDNWSDEFLDYEHIGIPQLSNDGEYMCTGFSIRTKEFMEKIIDRISLSDYYNYFEENGHGNDDVILHTHVGIDKLPPTSLKDKWGSRNVTGDTFGFHNEVEFDFDKAIGLLNK